MAKSRYVKPTEQLVTEIFVRDIQRAWRFYESLGFELLRNESDFVELAWEGHRLFLAEIATTENPEQGQLPAAPRFPPANLRVMVPYVDDLWLRAAELGATVVAPIADRSYGLRDFTISDPDGFGVRFATRLDSSGRRRSGDTGDD